MMSKNSIVPFLKDYLIKFLTRPFLLDTNDVRYKKQTLPRRKNKLNKNTPQLINIVFTGILSKIKNR